MKIEKIVSHSPDSLDKEKSLSRDEMKITPRTTTGKTGLETKKRRVLSLPHGLTNLSKMIQENCPLFEGENQQKDLYTFLQISCNSSCASFCSLYFHSDKVRFFNDEKMQEKAKNGAYD